jgi:hypothetical protein
MPLKEDHTVTAIFESLAEIKKQLEYMPTTRDLTKEIKEAFNEHREQFCYQLHPLDKRGGVRNGNGTIDIWKLAKFIGILIGSAVLAGSGGYFLGR